MFDLDAGPVTITLPEAGQRFRSLMVVNHDHYVPSVTYRAGAYTFTRQKIGTRYMLAAVRTLVDPADPNDVRAVHALQDGIKISQKSTGRWEAPSWDPVSQKKVRDALLALATTMPDFRRAFGTRNEVDPMRHLVASLGRQSRQGRHLPQRRSAKNDGTTVYRLRVNEVPVDGFRSISVCNEQGYYEKNSLDAYTINSITGKKGLSSITVQFGGCDAQVPNCRRS